MLDVVAISERIAVGGMPAFIAVLRKYGIDIDEEYTRQMKQLVVDATHGDDNDMVGAVIGSFVLGLEYAAVYNAEEKLRINT